MVTQCFDADLDPQPAYTIETLRRGVTRRAEVGAAGLLDTIFLQVLGYDEKLWNRNPPADKWSHRLLTGESERPRQVYADSFPVFIERPEIRLGLGRGRQSVARAVEWLRKAKLNLACSQQNSNGG
jgi:hypothetical protein